MINIIQNEPDRLAVTQKLLYGATTLLPSELLSTTPILMVGAGGIGCELLKNLVASGFRRITVLDLDTIELSNLNRQFLFTKADISKPKAVVACQAIGRLFDIPNLELTPIVGNILTFKLDFFIKFEMVLSALDNLDARRHVNLQSVMGGIPIIESGTAGYAGQAGAWVEGAECFDCRHHSPPTTYPACTIRATPTQMIHCIVWARDFLLGQVFMSGDDSGEDRGIDQIDNQNSNVELSKKESAAFRTIGECGCPDELAEKLFQKVFIDDIEELLKMEEVWKGRPVKPIPYCPDNDQSIDSSDLMRDWNLATWSSIFKSSLKQLLSRNPPVAFDKDDNDVMAFVAAAANLRAAIFQCTPKTVSLFKAKEMAGNIIPAVATTNSIASSIACLLAINVVVNRNNEKKGFVGNVYISHGATKRVLTRENLEGGNVECGVCNTNRHLVYTKSVESTTIQGLLNVILPVVDEEHEVSVMFKGRLLYDSIDMPESTKAKSLADFGIVVGDIVSVVIDDNRPYLLGILLEEDASDPTDGKLKARLMNTATKPALTEGSDTIMTSAKKRSLEDDTEVVDAGRKVVKLEVSDSGDNFIIL